MAHAPKSGQGVLDAEVAPFRGNIIHVLPTEILSHILCLCIPRFRPFTYTAHEATEVLRLGRISRFLRAIVYSTPKLWASVTFFVRPSDNFRRVAEWLDRARVLHLCIRIKILHENHWDDQADMAEWRAVARLMNIVRPYLRRCVDLDLMLPYPQSNILPETPGALQLLKTLTIQLAHRSFRPLSWFNITPDTAPHLREVGLFGTWIEKLQIPWQALQVLHLEYIFTRECVFVLRHAPNIVHLNLSQISTRPPNHGFGYDSDLDSPIVLPHLQTIDWLERVEVTMLPLFQLIVAPSLMALRIVPPDQGSFHSACIFSLLRPCHDTFAFVVTMNLLDDEIFELWAHLPGVTVVGLPMWKREGGLERPPLNSDLISLYDAPSSREWSKVTHFLPRTRDIQGRTF